MANTEGMPGAQRAGEGPLQPEVLDAPGFVAAATADGEGDDGREQVSRPTKLIRIASMVRSLLEEARRAPSTTSGAAGSARSTNAR